MKLEDYDSCDTAVFIGYLKHHLGLLYSVGILITHFRAPGSFLYFLE